MRVKIGPYWYDGETMKICIELTDADKANIRNMTGDANRYATFPEGSDMTNEEKLAWMEGDDRPVLWLVK